MEAFAGDFMRMVAGRHEKAKERGHERLQGNPEAPTLEACLTLTLTRVVQVCQPIFAALTFFVFFMLLLLNQTQP